MMRPARPRRELPHVAALFVVVLFVGFFPVASGRRTFSPNGLFADQAGIRGGDYPYGRPSRPVVGDAAATAYLFEPWAKTVHDAYAAGAIPLWDPHPALGAPLAASMQSAPFGPFYLPLFVHPSQRVWAFVILLRLLVGGVGCFALLRALNADYAAAFVAATGYLLAPAFVTWAASVSMSVEALAPWLLLAIRKSVTAFSWSSFAATAILGAAAALGGQPEVLIVLAWVAVAWSLYCWRSEHAPIRRLVPVAAAGATAFLLAAPQLLLATEYVPLAVTTHKYALGSARMSLNRFLPFLIGDFAHRTVAGFGICAFVLATGGAIAGRSLRSAGGIRGTSFALGVMVFWMVRAVGLPGEQLAGLLPGIAHLNFPRYGHFAFVLGGAILVAAGVEAISRKRRSGVAAACLATLFPLTLWAAGGPVHRSVLPAFAFAVATALGAVIVFRRRRFAPMLAIIVIAQFLALTPRDYAFPYNPFSPRPFVRFLQQHLKPGERAIGVRRVMPPQFASALGISDPRTRDALYPRRYSRYITYLVGGRPAGFAGFITMRDVSSPFLAAIAVRYVVALSREGKPPGDFQPVYRDPLEPVVVWRNNAAYPRAWLPPGHSTAANATDAEKLLRSGDGDLRATSVIERPTPAMAAAHGTGVATVDELGWNDERLRVKARGNAVLVVSDLYYPGWKATVDGRDTPIRPANLAMRAIAVPTESHTVVFRYQPSRFRDGLFVAALALAVLIALTAASALRRHRRWR